MRGEFQLIGDGEGIDKQALGEPTADGEVGLKHVARVAVDQILEIPDGEFAFTHRNRHAGISLHLCHGLSVVCTHRFLEPSQVQIGGAPAELPGLGRTEMQVRTSGRLRRVGPRRCG